MATVNFVAVFIVLNVFSESYGKLKVLNYWQTPLTFSFCSFRFTVLTTSMPNQRHLRQNYTVSTVHGAVWQHQKTPQYQLFSVFTASRMRFWRWFTHGLLLDSFGSPSQSSSYVLLYVFIKRNFNLLYCRNLFESCKCCRNYTKNSFKK